MKMLWSTSIFTILIVCFLDSISSRPGNNDENLLQVQMIVRHGARTPSAVTLRHYPKDPYTKDNYYPYDFEQLTLEGKRGAYLLGTRIRERYGHLLNNTIFEEQSVHLTATHWKRAQETILSLSAGLLPPKMEEKIVDYLNWKPLAYTIWDMHPYDDESEYHLAYWSSEFVQRFEKYIPYIPYIKSNSGAKDIPDLATVYGTLVSQERIGMKLPEWSKKVYPDILRNISGLVLMATVFAPEKKRALCETTLDIIKLFKKTVKARKLVDVPLHIHGGHDDNIAVALYCLNADFDQFQVLYTGSLALELYNKPYWGVKVRWQESEKADPIYVPVRGCNNILCDFETFEEMVNEASVNF